MTGKDPLVHFLLIGGALFVLLSWLASEPAPERILISSARVSELARSAELLRGRTPTRAELEALVAEAVREEVYYRRALQLGLDVDDDEVRRRLIEKMRYLNENVADPEPPDADLEAWFDENREMFLIPELVSFDQVFFSPRDHGDAARSDADSALVRLRQGSPLEEFGDDRLFDNLIEAADRDRVSILFGEALTEAVFTEPVGIWFGPFESDFGWHVVRIAERSAARDPEFAEVEAAVRSAFTAEQLALANQAAFEEMLGYFDVAVEWEAGLAAADWP